MTQEPQKSNTVLIFIAIIGVVGTIAGATIVAIGNYNVEKFRQQAELTRIALVYIATQGEPRKYQWQAQYPRRQIHPILRMSCSLLTRHIQHTLRSHFQLFLQRPLSRCHLVTILTTE